MKKTLRWICLLLTLTCLFGCGPQKIQTEETTEKETTQEIPEGNLRIVVEDYTPYLIMNQAERLQEILEEAWNIEIPIVTDAEPVQKKEILFGNTNRSFPKAVSEKLVDEADFIISFNDYSGYITGKNDTVLTWAMDVVEAGFEKEANMKEFEYQDSVKNPRTKPEAKITFSDLGVEGVKGSDVKIVNGTIEEGIHGKAVYLSDKGGYVSLGKGFLGDVAGDASQITINLWVMAYQNRMSRLCTFYNAASKEAFYVDYRMGYLRVYARSKFNDNVSAMQYNYVADAKHMVSEPNDVSSSNSGIWQMLTFEVDFAKSTFTFYVNGKEVKGTVFKEGSFGSTKLIVGEPTVCDSLGGFPEGTVESEYGFCGLIGECSIYKKALSEKEVLQAYYAYSDTNSPCIDNDLILAISKKLSTGAALVPNAYIYCSNGMQKALDTSDYTQKTKVENGVWYVPEAFGKSYFSATYANCTLKDHYYSLKELCEKGDYKLLTSEKYNVAIVSEEAWDEENDAVYLERLYRLMTEYSYELPVNNTEQSRVVVATADGVNIVNCFGPNVLKVGSTIYVTMTNRKNAEYIYASKDDGKTFELLSVLKGLAGCIFEHQGNFYIMGTHYESTGNQIGISKSTDGCKTWSSISIIPYTYSANAYCTGSILHANGRFYKAYEGYDTTAWVKDKRAYVVSAADTSNLLDPNSWTISNWYSYETSDLMSALGEDVYTDKTFLQEGDMLQLKDGTIVDVLRLDCYSVYNHAVCCTASEDGKTFTYDKTKSYALINIPTGADKFHIEYDETSGYYIGLVNIKTTSYRPYQRNVLSLVVSKDLVNWEIATNLLVDRTMMNSYISMTSHAFSYVQFIIDGNDILYVVREAMGKSQNYHDNNLLTFYWVENCREFLK